MEKREGDHDSVRAMFRDRLGRWSIRSVQILAVLALVVVATLALIEVSVVVIPLFVALLIASSAAPLISWLRRLGLSPLLSAWVALLMALLVLGGLVAVVILTVRAQWEELSSAAAAGYDELRRFAANLPGPLAEVDWDAVRDHATEVVMTPRFGVGAISGVTTVVNVLTGTVLVVVLLFFFLKDGDAMWRFFTQRLEGEDRERAHRIGETSVKVLGGYVRGTAIVALVDAVAIGLGLALLRVPLAFPLAVLVFLGSFVPYVGAVLVGALAALVALVTSGWAVALGVVGVVLVVNQLEGDLLQPVIMSQTVSLHPLVVLVAIAAGTVVSGIVGALLAVPITALVWAVVKVWNGPAPEPPPKPPSKLRRLLSRRGSEADEGADAHAAAPEREAADLFKRRALRSELDHSVVLVGDEEDAGLGIEGRRAERRAARGGAQDLLGLAVVEAHDVAHVGIGAGIPGAEADAEEAIAVEHDDGVER